MRTTWFKRLTLFAMALVCLAACSPKDSGDIESSLSYSEAINKAGRQRMLTQRITKLYSLGSLFKDSTSAPEHSYQDQLREAVELFDTQLRELDGFAPNREVKAALGKVRTLWGPFKRRALSVPDTEIVTTLWKSDQEVLEASEKVVQILQDISGTSYARLVNISGRQRMLSQRIAKFYMLRALGVTTQSMHQMMEQTKNEFVGALDTLRKAPENTPVINEKLEQVSLQWDWLVGALDLYEEPEFPLIVNDASEKTLQLMEDLTGLYEQLN